MSERFEVKDLGPIHYCLGIEFSQENRSVTMKQKDHIRDVS